MDRLVIDALIVFFLGLFLVPNLRAGSLARRILEMVYGPVARFGFWHRWSMYAPEVPKETSIGLTGVVLEDGTFEVVPLPGLDDDTGFGKARGLRFISFQLALCDPLTGYLEPALYEETLRRWHELSAVDGEKRPVAVELRVYSWPSPEPGRRDEDPRPEIRTVWTRAIEEGR